MFTKIIGTLYQLHSNNQSTYLYKINKVWQNSKIQLINNYAKHEGVHGPGGVQHSLTGKSPVSRSPSRGCPSTSRPSDPCAAAS